MSLPWTFLLFHLFIAGKFYGKCIISQRTGRRLPSDTGMDLSVFIFELNLNQYYKRSWEGQRFLYYKYTWIGHPHHWCPCIYSTNRNERISVGTASQSVCNICIMPPASILILKKENPLIFKVHLQMYNFILHLSALEIIGSLKNSNHTFQNDWTQIGFQHNPQHHHKYNKHYFCSIPTTSGIAI